MASVPSHRHNPRVWNRRLHRWGAAAIGIPFLLILVTGALLQVKKQVAWVQPSEQRTSAREPTVPYAVVLERARAVPTAGIRSWADVDRIDVRPDKGILKLVAKSQWEIQMDIATGEVLQVAYRRSDIIESLHDLSWFRDGARLWVGVPVAVVLLSLWISGVYMWLVHLKGKQRSRRVARNRGAERSLVAARGASVPLGAQQVQDAELREAARDGGAAPEILSKRPALRDGTTRR